MKILHKVEPDAGTEVKEVEKKMFKMITMGTILNKNTLSLFKVVVSCII